MQERIGPYELERPLGEGGMGVVWRARHAESGHLVALKTVRLLHARQLDGLRREIRALSRIEHPGIVRILDQGVHDGAPWYAMEVLEGPSLRQRARQLGSEATSRLYSTESIRFTARTTLDVQLDGDLPLDMVPSIPPPAEARLPAAGGRLPEILQLVRGLCDPVGFLHGEGIVHRDLKPENVVVLDGGRPVLVDFGLVALGAAGREQLTVDAMLHGTASYMSPEQIRGELVDARADLYALGVILYEIVTGRLPFVGASTGATLYQALQRPPVAPSERVTGVPPALDELILALLEKRREDRPGYAADVARMLEEVGCEAPSAPIPRPRPHLYRPGFAGRSEALRTLHAALELRRGVVLLGGEPGVGKTRLAIEFAREATARGRAVMVGECHAAEAGSRDARGGPLHPLRAALLGIADRCMQGAPATIEKLLGDRGSLLARYQPALLDVPGVAEQPSPERLDPEAEHNRILRWLSLTLTAAGSPNGTILLLDDVQWADELTLDWLAHAARTDTEGLVVVATYAVDEVRPRLRALLDNPGVTPIELRALATGDVRAMASDMLALRDVPPGLVAFLGQVSDGNPFLVAEYLRAAVTQGALERSGSQWRIAADPHADVEAWAELPVPRRLEDLVLSRVQRLGHLALEALEAAAVAGGDLQLDRIARIARPDLDPDDPEWLDALSELLDAHVVEAESDRLRFVHDRVREVVLADLGSDRRRSLHHAVAQVLEAEPGADASALSHHWLEAGETGRAGLWLFRAASSAVDQVAHADAERHLRAYLALEGMPEADRLGARIELGRVLSTLGRNSEALDVLDEARTEARMLPFKQPLADVIAALGDVAATVGRLEDALILYREELDLRREIADPADTARALLRVASGVAATSTPAHAASLATEALDHARACGDPVLEGEVLLALATWGAAGPDGAHTLLLEAKQRFDAAGARLQQARALDRLGTLATGTAALARFEEALALYRAIGERVRTGRTLTRIAQVQHELGATPESRTASAEALQVFREIGHHRFQGHTLHALGVQLRREGRLLEAEGLARQALTLLTVVGDRPWLVRTELELARLALCREHAEAAASHAGRARVLARQIGRVEEEADAMHLAGRARAERGEWDRALTLHRAEGELAEQHRLDARAARALVFAARAERHLGTTAPGDLDALLDAALERLDGAPWRAVRCSAWCERAHLAVHIGASPGPALERARLALAETRYPDALAARELARADAASTPGT